MDSWQLSVHSFEHHFYVWLSQHLFHRSWQNFIRFISLYITNPEKNGFPIFWLTSLRKNWTYNASLKCQRDSYNAFATYLLMFVVKNEGTWFGWRLCKIVVFQNKQNTSFFFADRHNCYILNQCKQCSNNSCAPHIILTFLTIPKYNNQNKIIDRFLIEDSVQLDTANVKIRRLIKMQKLQDDSRSQKYGSTSNDLYTNVYSMIYSPLPFYIMVPFSIVYSKIRW